MFDGTVESGGGPVKTEWLQKLHASDGVIVTIVSSSGKRPSGLGLHENIKENRLESLEDVKREWFGAAAYIYVSDNAQDEDLSKKTGFIYVHPTNFRLLLSALP